MIYQPLLTVEETRAADCLAIESGIPSLSLMEAAGYAVAREVARLTRKSQRIVVLCGPGNNGGDGFVAARYLHRWGWSVWIATHQAWFVSTSSSIGDGAYNYMRCLEALGSSAFMPLSSQALDKASWVVDALFGAGLSRPIEGAAADVIECINQRKLPCVAVDIPSGCDGDTGDVCGMAPQCCVTVTFFHPKMGHVLYPAKACVGRLVISDIGIPSSVLDTIQPRTFVNNPSLWHVRFPEWRDHKYDRGHLVVYAGQMPGAAVLAANAARRAGAGMVTILTPAAKESLCPPLGSVSVPPGLIVKAVADTACVTSLIRGRKVRAWVIGPGAGCEASLRDLVMSLLKTACPLVLDADALTVFYDDPGFHDDPGVLRAAIQSSQSPVVVTPHEGEFKKICPHISKGSRLDRARHAAKWLQATVVYKGPDTVVASPDGRATITAQAEPWLATAGSGDVLAGVIGALLATGADPFSAGCAGVWIHAEASRRFGPGMIAEDLITAFPDILARLRDDSLQTSSV